MKYFKITKWQ